MLDIDPKRPSREDADSAGVSETPVVETSWCPRAISVGASATPPRGVHAKPVFTAENATDSASNAAEYEEVYDTDAYVPTSAETVFTRTTDPFNVKRVERVVESVRIGPDLTDDQRATVRALVAEYADVFALAVSEVTPVAGAVYAPKTLQSTLFPDP
ncbi:hypothetical protein B0H13DRAFT_2366848 [Mycena leptocephala]|nr:hypothetical protein B0H13DRAFT_2366848 [Mycena leptocephala]